MSECIHDPRFAGVFLMPVRDNGCLACGYERLTAENETLKRKVLFLSDEECMGCVDAVCDDCDSVLTGQRSSDD